VKSIFRPPPEIELAVPVRHTLAAALILVKAT
jgi:hypothetical protein